MNAVGLPFHWRIQKGTLRSFGFSHQTAPLRRPVLESTFTVASRRLPSDQFWSSLAPVLPLGPLQNLSKSRMHGDGLPL